MVDLKKLKAITGGDDFWLMQFLQDIGDRLTG